jgi:hypothetical protein
VGDPLDGAGTGTPELVDPHATRCVHRFLRLLPDAGNRPFAPDGPVGLRYFFVSDPILLEGLVGKSKGSGFVRRSAKLLYAWGLPAALAVSVLSCGRSENVGWADREVPDSIAARVAAEPGARPETPESRQAALREEYQQLARALGRVQMQAMADTQLSSLWNGLIQDVDAKIFANSDFHRRLLERRSEIEGVFAQARATGQEVPPDKRAELSRNYRNIEIEMARIRNQVLRMPEFAERYMAIQAMLFAKMKELAPDQVVGINRMEELESQFFQPVEEAPPPVPGMQPVR